MLIVRSWIVHLACSPLGVSIVNLLNVLLQAGHNGLPPILDTLHLECYKPHALQLPFLSTWCVVLLEKNFFNWIGKVTAYQITLSPGKEMSGNWHNSLQCPPNCLSLYKDAPWQLAMDVGKDSSNVHTHYGGYLYPLVCKFFLQRRTNCGS